MEEWAVGGLVVGFGCGVGDKGMWAMGAARHQDQAAAMAWRNDFEERREPGRKVRCGELQPHHQ